MASPPTITLKDIDLLDRICIVDDAPLEIPSLLLEDFDIVKQETRGYVYTRPNVMEYYERMFPKMRVRTDEQFQEKRLLDWLQRLRQKEKYRYHKHVLVLDLCCTERQLTSTFIQKLVEVIHNFGDIIFILSVPSTFENHALFYKFDRVILGQHIQHEAPLWETLGEDVRDFYANISRGQKFLTWNVKDSRYEILDVNYQEPLSNSQYNNQYNTQGTCPKSDAPQQSQQSKQVPKDSQKKKKKSQLQKQTESNTKQNELGAVGAVGAFQTNGENYENREDCIIL